MPAFRAYIDESGQRAATVKSSDYFIMSAVIVPDRSAAESKGLLASMRADLGRLPGHPLHWSRIRGHADRLRGTQALGRCGFLRVSSVIVCKRYLKREPDFDDDSAYLYTFKYLLERLSWFADDEGGDVGYTLAHVVHFPKEKLRDYERRLRQKPSQIRWHAISGDGAMDQPSRIEELQLADIAASATAAAFNADRFGNTEPRYLKEIAPVLYRRKGKLISYGMKMHPWDSTTSGMHAWVATL
jgi:hypothetical protein